MAKVLPTLSYQRYSCQCCNIAHLCLPAGFKQHDFGCLSDLENKSIAVKTGESICLADEAFYYLYAIRKGSVKDSTVTRDGHEQVTDFYLPGEIVGLEAIHTGKYLCNSIALEPSRICLIPYDNLLKLAAQFPKLQTQLINLISQKLLDRTRSLIRQYHCAETRIATFLLNISTRYKRRGYSATDYYLTMSRHDIGSYLNLTPETVSRIFTKLQEEGIIVAYKKHVQLINLKKLTAKSFI